MSDSTFVPVLEIASADGDRVLPSSAEGPVEVWEGNGVDAYGYSGAGDEWIHLPGVATFLIPSGETPTVVAIPDEQSSEQVVLDTYRRSILPLVMQMRGTPVLHASAVKTPCGVLAICGRSGAGKSTLAHGLSQRGYDVVADDAVGLLIGDAEARVLPLPFSLKLGGTPPSADSRSETYSASGLDHESRLDAIVVLDVVAEFTSAIELARLEASAAFTALLPHAYYYRIADRDRIELLMDGYLRLAAATTVWSARILHDATRLSAVLDRLETDAAGVTR